MNNTHSAHSEVVSPYGSDAGIVLIYQSERKKASWLELN